MPSLQLLNYRYVALRKPSKEAKHSKLETLYQKEKEVQFLTASLLLIRLQKWMAEVKQIEAEIALVAKQIDRVNTEAANELGRSHKSVEALELEYVFSGLRV